MCEVATDGSSVFVVAIEGGRLFNDSCLNLIIFAKWVCAPSTLVISIVMSLFDDVWCCFYS